MFGRQTFLESVVDQHEQRRRNEIIRQLVVNQGQRIPFKEFISIPSLRNDGSSFDLNFIVFDDAERVQPNDVYFRTQQTDATNRYLLDYIRQMEERYITMERELARTKMLVPMITQNTISMHQKPQRDANSEEYSLAKKYRRSFEGSSGNEDKNIKPRESKNQERISAKKKRHATKKNKESMNRTSDGSNWIKRRNLFQNSQTDTHPTTIPTDYACRSKTLTNNTTAISYSVSPVSPEVPIQSANVAKSDQNNNNSTGKITNKYEATKTFDSSKYLASFKVDNALPPNKKTLMEACQRFDEKHEPETPCRIDFGVKHEDHMQAGSTVNTSTVRPITGSDTESTSKVENRESSTTVAQEKHAVKKRFFENIGTRRTENPQTSETLQGNRNHWNGHLKNSFYERGHTANDAARNFPRLVHKHVRGQKRTPTPRSNVHTSYTPMAQAFALNPMSNPNEFTIQLLKLAVLLYAPALMPALNALIARQNYHTSIPIPCFEGSNDALAQVFRILNSQQCVPNLSYTNSPGVAENLPSPMESSSPNPSLNTETHVEKRSLGDPNSEHATSKQECNSIGVNTSVESCTCNNPKLSSPRSSDYSLFEQNETKEWEYLLDL